MRVRVESGGWGNWDVEVKLERLPSRIRLDVRVDGTTTWMFGGPNVRIQAFVPEGASVDLYSTGGEIRIEDLTGGLRGRVRDADAEIRGVSGPVKLKIANGSLEVEELTGSLEVTTDVGDIRAAWITGAVEARTNDGAIVLRHVTGDATAKSLDGDLELREIGGAVTARTERGRVTVGFAGNAGGTIETERGDLAIELAEGGGADLDARAADGTVELANGLPWRGEHADGRAIGTIGEGGGRLVLRSARGGIRVGAR